MDTTAPPHQAQTLYIGGSWTSGVDSFERFLPSDLSRSAGVFAAAGPTDVVNAYAAAAAAGRQWGETPAPARAEILQHAADLIVDRCEEAAHRLTDDMGKAIRDARAEVLRSAQILRWFAGETQQANGETYPSADSQTFLMTVEQPMGVVCVITPWNFPWAIPTWKLAPALGFGNTVVWKPAAAASGSAVMLTEILVEAGLPPGVLNLVTGGGGALSETLTGDPHLAALTFTGSANVGVGLREAVADRNVKIQLELGGKNPAIVLADADLEDAATQIVRGAMLATGQRCTATSRVYVERAVSTELRDHLVRLTEALLVGDPYDEQTDVGPLASEEQRLTVGEFLALARDEKAEILTGGSLGDGCFVQPTILCNVSADSRLMRDEIFGPVLVLEDVQDFESALAAANDTEFGLSSAVFTTDLKRAFEFVKRTESGLVHVNRETAGVEPHVPFGGVKASSSMAREQGTAARQFFTSSKTAYVRVP